MKILKVVLIAIVTAITFSTAEAQVSIHARIGARPVHRRTVVVHRVYHRPVYRHHYYHHPYRRMAYHRYHH
ncbi:hypothetical protein C8P68_101435 [Mucilaginibacter yixingensis]|uniref:Uncharacterized protein n=1 Tax=Mucilaginibacter yixingensis TaxID=1295612 RepID=A0A2T5JFJ3_9SPHI|nr:hypothetical protein [Mucilaginibacter yixingensis]PTR01201.1 hypothetical protein C8P68_101435 [Mucilaginibacter yixingensis]